MNPFGGLPYPLSPARYRDTANLTFSYATDGDALSTNGGM
jgi:hypothetical protein